MTTTHDTSTRLGLPRTTLPDDLHAHHLLLLTCGVRLARIVQVINDLGLADMLVEGPATAEDLAARTETDPASLYRILRAASSLGIFVEEPVGTFAITPLGEGLRSNYTDGVQPLVKYSTMELTTRPYAEIMHSVKTGEPAFEKAFGMSFYQYLEQNPAVEAFFERFMMHWSRQTLRDEAWEQLAMHRFATIADLGGGDGYFLAHVLKHNPHLTAHLLDLPTVVASAGPILEEHGVADRATVLPGDFFTDELPRGCDAYLFKGVLHNLSDAKAELLLRRVREAIGDTDARLLVLDHVMASANQWDFAKFLDIDMLVLFGGHERTREEFRSLFDRTGFELVSDPKNDWALLECRVR